MYSESESFEYDHHHIAIHDVDGHDSSLPASSHFISGILPDSDIIHGDGEITDDDARAAVQDYTYRQAPTNQIALLDAAIAPDYIIAPDRQSMALLGACKFRSLEGLSCKEIGLAGLRLDPRTSCLSRTTTYNTLSLISLSGPITSSSSSSSSITRSVHLPDGGRIMSPIFSYDSRYLAFLLYSSLNQDLATDSIPNPIVLYYIDCHDPDLIIHRLSNHPVSQIFGKPFAWTSANAVIFRTPLPGRGPIPTRPQVPVGPVILESGLGHDVKRRSGGARTYQDLLKDSFDCHLFEYFCTAQVIRCSPLNPDDDHRLPLIGIIKSCHPSPDGRYLLVKLIHRPYSYFIPHARFPIRIEIHHLPQDGDQVVLARQLADLNLADSVPISFDACRVGPRHVDWRHDAPAALVWVEAQDNGDPKQIPPDHIRDVLWTLSEPFSSPPLFLHAFHLRFKRIVFGDGHGVVTERWFKTRQRNTWIIDLDELKQQKSRLMWSVSFDDRYNDPGEVQTHADQLDIIRNPETGHATLTLLGEGAGPEGARPFVRVLNMCDLSERDHWRSSSTTYERPLLRLNHDRLIISREAPRQPPQLYLISISHCFPDIQLSQQSHPCPEMLEVQCQLVHYDRADGVKLSGYLYLPPGFHPGHDTPLPTLLWAYPREYKSIDTASQVTGSPNTFVLDGRPSLYFLLEGYAVLDRMTMPIVAEGPNAEPNDTYIEQLVANAAAAIDHLVAIGVTDRERVGVGGHSYGAFMTANLLAHSNLFAAGVARSGAYNRTLTPFGFQKEERTLWEAPEVYHAMSPYMAADRIRTPLLLIHGQADNNAGTYPMQSERMFAALKSHAKAPARIVLLPHESHHYKSRESCAHVLWETTRWFSKYVKNKNNPKHIRSRSIYL